MKKIAILSGKGGSGKTCLSLSIANLLSTSGIKTLLLDCDFSTNGATYFFEDILRQDSNYISLQHVACKEISGKKLVHIQKNFDFIPSVTKIDGTSIDATTLSKFDFSSIDEIINNYSVVLYDCQAGYSEILDSILPTVDQTLFVMEADAISSASIRSLHLKIGSLLTSKSYQIFNKVTNEEYQVYNKLSGGTFFTNIESVLFDWTIRKAFALSTIPSIRNVDSLFWEQIINICKIIFTEQEFQDKIKNFSKMLFSKKIQKERESLTKELQHLKELTTKRRRKLFITATTCYSLIVLFVIFFFILKEKSFLHDSFDPNTMFSFGIALSSALLSFLSISLLKQKNEKKETMNYIKNKLENLSIIEEKYK